MKINEAFFQDTALPQQAQGVWEHVRPILEPVLKTASMAQQRAFFRVLGNSNFLARWARRHPDLMAHLLKEDWGPGYGVKQFQKELQNFIGKTGPKGDERALQQKLIQFKYRQLWRITARDMGLGVPFPVIAGEISDLARILLNYSYERERSRLAGEWGEPLLKKKAKTAIPFSIIAMGKLGGSELNYSSDVDLIYLYESDDFKKPVGKKSKTITPHEFFCKLAERLGQLLGQKTPNGFLFRVDLELRPEGKGGPLANSLPAMEYYYENFGAFWEKQAMIKASPAGGSEELFQSFYRMIHPFVYPKTTDYSLLGKVQEMKEKVLAEVEKSSDKGFHVKLGPGGIREIEFFVQSLQILYGGQNPQLETPNTLSAIAKIAQAKLISTSIEQGLREAYLFLRTLENRLQQVEEQQTHRLPEDPEERLQLVRRMGYLQADSTQAVESFEGDLSGHCRFVQDTFASLLSKRFGDLQK